MSYWNNQQATAELRERVLTAAGEAEAVQFGLEAIDVGGRSGEAIPFIRTLGVSKAVLVDPEASEIDVAVRSGLVALDDAYACTLQEYAAMQKEPVASAFVFNMQPNLSGNTDFVRALGGVVRMGGIVVATMREPATVQRFRSLATAQTCLVQVATAPPATERRSLAPHAFVQLWQRIR